MTNTLRMTMQDGTIREIALTDEQTMDTLQGRAVAYTPRDESVLVDDDGRIIHRSQPSRSDPRPRDGGRAEVRVPRAT